MSKLAILFPGQGSQSFGMGKDYYESLPGFSDKLNEASEILDLDLARICFQEEHMLGNSRYVQPAIVALSMILYDFVKRNVEQHELVFAGHSLGEFTAMYGGGIYRFAEVMAIVKRRGEIMDETAINNPGAMAAIISGDVEKIESLCHDLTDSGQIVSVANYNLPSQIVISGMDSAVTEFERRLTETKAKRFVRLRVQGAFHSRLMQDAVPRFREVLSAYVKRPPGYPILMNKDAKLIDLEILEATLADQLIKPVLFYQTLETLWESGVTRYLEIGPGKVLANLAKKYLPEAEVLSLSTYEDFQKLEGLI